MTDEERLAFAGRVIENLSPCDQPLFSWLLAEAEAAARARRLAEEWARTDDPDPNDLEFTAIRFCGRWLRAALDGTAPGGETRDGS